MDVFRERVSPLGGAWTQADITCDEQLQLLLNTLDLSQEAFVLADAETGEFLDCSPAAHQRLGYSRSEYLALGPSGLQADPEHDPRWIANKIREIQGIERCCFDTRHRCRDGTALDVTVHLRILHFRNRKLILAMHRDRTEMQQAMSRAERLNQLLLEAEQLTLVGSWELVHTTGELLWSEGTYRIFEIDQDSFQPSYDRFLDAVHPEDRELVDQTYRRSLDTHQPYQVNHRLCFSDGRQKVVQERGTTTYDTNGRPLRSIGTVQDISKLAEYEQQLERAAYTDSLTELPNRQGFLRQLTEVLDHSQPAIQRGLGIFNIDLDQFQAINDTFGPEVGDQLLIAISKVLLDIVPESSFIGRLESDEFALILPCGHGDLHTLARELQAKLQQTRLHESIIPLLPTISIGISHYPTHGSVGLQLVQAANTALMEAKRSGKGGVRVYSEGISERIRQRISLEAELKQAIEADAFHLAFQPQVDRQGALTGAEVLLRWHDSNGSPIPPSLFIPLAEQAGYIHDITSWVVNRACQHLKEWRSSGLVVPRLAINISALQFGMPEGALADSLLDILEQYGIEPDALELEITETALIDNPEQSQQESIALSRAGFKLAIDDFGTGYASMVSLHALPVSTIKIDTSFVQRMLFDTTDQAIVKSTILLAHELNIHALAEGVESEDQWNFLLDLGCDHFQGYLFGFPMTAKAFASQLQTIAAA